MTKQQILTGVMEIGTDLAKKANPSYWRFEDRSRAENYEKRTEALRQAYAQIRSGANPLCSLNLAKKIVNNGIECNMINRLIDKIKPRFI